jgi:hypothetical protein
LSQPLFYVSNPERKRRFGIATAIERSGDRLVARKSPLDTAAAGHVAKLEETYRTLSAVPGLSDLLSIAEPRIDGTTAEFDFIEGRNAERVLLERMLADERTDAIAMLDKLLAVIDALPAVTTNPADQEDYVEVFGRTYDRPEECAGIGALDLNLDNVIIGADARWHLIDYEWAFDFAIPKGYLFRRFLFWFFCVRYREALEHHAARLDSVCIASGTYVPGYLHTRYAPHFAGLEEATTAEIAFQEFVKEGPIPPLEVRFHDEPLRGGAPDHLGLEAILEDRRACALEVASLTQRLAEVSAQKQQVLDEKQLILESRTYRLARLIGRAKFWG